MGQNSNIEWTTHTANLWWGCQEVHEGCDNCYARTFARAKGKATAWEGARFAVGSIWSNLAKWERDADQAGRVDRVFTGSMMDIFEKSMPALTWSGEPTGETTWALRDRYFTSVVPSTPHLMHLLLTKRPSNLGKMVPPRWLVKWPGNVMRGTSVVNQATADTLIPQLRSTRGPNFLSVEPLLGPIDFRCRHAVPPYCTHCSGHEDRCKGLLEGIDWVIVGGESGPGARPMHPDWARSIRDQCVAAGVPFFFKQWGEYSPQSPIIPLPGGREVPRALVGDPETDEVIVYRVGKIPAGRMLDGRTWDQVPTPFAWEAA